MTYEKAMEMLIGDNKTTDFEMLGEFVQSNFLKVNLTFCTSTYFCMSTESNFNCIDQKKVKLRSKLLFDVTYNISLQNNNNIALRE